MKKRVLAMMIAGIMTLLPMTSFAATNASDWAQQEIDEAIELRLVPDELQDNYTENITRAEFAQLAVIFSATANGYNNVNKYVNAYLMENDDASYREDTFSDSDDFYVNCAATLNIVSGRGDGTFDPEGSITRQEAAVMLMNTYNTYAKDKTHTSTLATFDAAFSDFGQIASWAKESAQYMCEWGVMTGVGQNQYAPFGSYTREQAIATFLRLYSHGPQNIASGTAGNFSEE